jgi:hypothetical protein
MIITNVPLTERPAGNAMRRAFRPGGRGRLTFGDGPAPTEQRASTTPRRAAGKAADPLLQVRPRPNRGNG